jgi:hypothetical protein
MHRHSKRSIARLGLTAALTLVLTACTGTPGAAQLDDPADILTQSITSLQDVESMSVHGDVSGNAAMPDLGAAGLDLTGTTVDLAVDVADKSARIQASLPSLMGTSLDAIVVDEQVYLKLAGPMAGFLGTDGTKYLTMDASEAGDEAAQAAQDPTKALEELRAAIADLPTAPTKLEDQACGDEQCYHVQVKVTAEDLAALEDTDAALADVSGDLTLDVLSRKSDLHPASITLTVVSPDAGNLQAEFTFDYDGDVSIAAPSADQTVPMTDVPALPAMP